MAGEVPDRRERKLVAAEVRSHFEQSIYELVNVILFLI